MSSVLQELGPQAVAHRDEMEQVKKRLQIHHDFFDCWIYGFLENKKFDVEETVSKLQRREAMERNELANYDVTDYMRETMAKGIIQLIGEDKEGRVTFYIVTRRDYPTAKRREENKRNFDMWLSYGTRLRHHNKKCRITMLINQKDASMWSNTDMTFQADVALRIAKYYPGAVDRMYITKMSNTLATMAKPIFSRLPAIVSDRIRIFTESDIEKGKLLELFDENVLPKDLGGKNDCDGVKNWTAFATTIEDHFTKLKEAVGGRGLSVKEWELETLQRENAEALTDKRNQRATQRLSSMRKLQQLSGVASGTGEGGLDGAGDVDAASDAELKSCFSGDDDDEYEDDADYGMYRQQYGYQDGEVCSPTRVQPLALPQPNPFPPTMMVNDSVAGAGVGRYGSVRVPPHQQQQLAPHLRFFFDEERRWRHAITIHEAESRLTLCDRRLDAFLETENAEEDIFGSDGTRRLATFVPAPARSMLNFFLQCCCVLSAVYFAAATVFCAAVVCSIAVTFFFGMFSEPLAVFPVGMCFLLMAFQGAMVCSRGVELTRRSYYGRLLPGFRTFGSWAQPMQLIFTFTLLLIQFIIFVVYAVRWDTLNGLKVAFATGWLSCSILIALHHIFFWLASGESDYDPSSTGGGASNRKTRLRSRGVDDASKGALPIYLLFDLTEDDEEENSANRTSGLLLVTVPVIVSLLLGVAFLTTKLLALAVAVPLATITAAWALNAFVDDSTKRYHAVPTKFLIWFAAVAWMFDCYTFGFREYSARWASPVITVSLLTGVFLVLAVLTHRRGNSSRVLRLVLLLIVAYSLACVVMTFVAVRWSLGVFAIVMVVHAALCVSRNSGSAITIAGRFLVAAGIALVLIAAVMLGWSGTSQSYSVPRASASSGSPIVQTSPAFGVLTYTQWERTPLCALFLDTPLGNASLSPATTNVSQIPGVSVLDAALLVELSNAATPEAFEHDMQRWFGNGSTAPVVGDSVVPFPTSLPPDELPAFTARSYTFGHAPAHSGAVNVTFLVLQSPYKLESIKAMMVWVEAIALSPLSIFLPSNWTSNVIRPYSFATDMIPFRFLIALDDLRAYVAAQQGAWARLYGPKHQLYLVGEGVGGGLAALAATLDNIQALVFNAPGLSQVLGKFDVDEQVFLQTIISIHAVDAALSTIGGSKPHSHSVPCGLDAETCQSIAFLTGQLIQLCEPSE